jgi:integrase
VVARHGQFSGEEGMATKLGLKQVQALRVGEVIWDTAVSGFGARRKQGLSVTYVLKYRTKEGRQRWYTIGRHGAPWTPDSARDEAKRLLGQVVGGSDPASVKISGRSALTVNELCDLYFADAKAGRVLKRAGTAKKASTLAVDRGRIERHIKPLIGRMAVASVTREDIEKLLHDIANGKSKAKVKTKSRGLAVVTGGKTAANRVVGLLGAIFTYAVRHRMRTDNPVHGSQRFADTKRERRLSDEEYKALGVALEKAKAVNLWPPAMAAADFLALTGWRKSEALELRWDAVDLPRRTATLGDTKTGRSIRPLSHAASQILTNLGNSGGLVFKATRNDNPMSGFRKFWLKIIKLGELPADITPNTLRHSFSSLASDLGYSEPTIAAMVGHKGRTITSRYVHTADAVLLAAADAVANRTAELMGIRPSETKVLPFRNR